MRYTKRCQHNEKWTFHWPSSGGYIRLEKNGKPGTLGRQICKGGGFMGSTLSAMTRSSFERKVDKWVNNHRRKHKMVYDTCYLCDKKLKDEE